ncbi:MAG: acetylglutamate kinase [bacterium]|nr:acetylglutamate kinase [Candidatus Kapabacteria bacterium]
MIYLTPELGVSGGLTGPAVRPRIVLKLGGSTMSDGCLEGAFADDVAWLVEEGADVVVVHGGGAGITALATALGLETRFVDGQRYTSKETIGLVEMTLAGTVNTEVVRTLRAHNVNAFGLSGVDGGLLTGERHDYDGVDLGLVGRIASVDSDVLALLWRSRLVPVIAPLTMDENGVMLNINADVAAAAIAEAIGAVALVYLSDVEGVKVGDAAVELLFESNAAELIESGEISGGMVPKVRSAFESLANGVAAVAIIDGRDSHSVREYFTGQGTGTRFVRGADKCARVSLAA